AEQQFTYGGSGLFDFVEQNDRQITVRAGRFLKPFLSQNGFGLAMSEVARGRTDELCYFVIRLKLTAINLYDCLWRSMQNFCERFDCSCFSRSRWTEKQKYARRPAQRSQTCLISFHG